MNKQKIAKPSFRETIAVTTMDLDDVGFSFNAQRVGPMNFFGLRNANYGKGFRMPTLPEIVLLVYISLENKDCDTAKNVIKTLKKYWLTGNTAVHYFPKGMFVQDNPKMKDGKIVPFSQKTLERKLGKHQEKEVIFSEDKKIRFVPYDFKREFQSALDLARNPGIIALVRSEENAEKLAKASKHYKKGPCFWALENVGSPRVRVAGLGSDDFDDWFGVGAGYSEYCDEGCSFGVLDRK